MSLLDHCQRCLCQHPEILVSVGERRYKGHLQELGKPFPSHPNRSKVALEMGVKSSQIKQSFVYVENKQWVNGNTPRWRVSAWA